MAPTFVHSFPVSGSFCWSHCTLRRHKEKLFRIQRVTAKKPPEIEQKPYSLRKSDFQICFLSRNSFNNYPSYLKLPHTMTLTVRYILRTIFKVFHPFLDELLILENVEYFTFSLMKIEIFRVEVENLIQARAHVYLSN